MAARYGDVQSAAELSAAALPTPRGPLTERLFAALGDAPHPLLDMPLPADDPLDGDDSALALYCCYELHYRGFEQVDDAWEWEPSLLGWRRQLEAAFVDRLREVVGPVEPRTDIRDALYGLLAGPSTGRSLSSYLAEDGSLTELREYAVHRSAYQLKEADPHSWAIPRLAGAPKAALVLIQSEEYGGGEERDMHQNLFALTMRELGLDPAYGAYLDTLPGTTLATTNLVSLFGLHRRWRGALVGHLAIFEMTSVEPMGRYSLALRRHGLGSAARHFYEVHVVADAYHEQVAAGRLAAGLVQQDPRLAADVLFGAHAVTRLEQRFSSALLGAWTVGGSSLRHPLAEPVPVSGG